MKFLSINDSLRVERIDQFTWSVDIQLTLHGKTVKVSATTADKAPTAERMAETVLRQLHHELGVLLDISAPQ